MPACAQDIADSLNEINSLEQEIYEQQRQLKEQMLELESKRQALERRVEELRESRLALQRMMGVEPVEGGLGDFAGTGLGHAGIEPDASHLGDLAPSAGDAVAQTRRDETPGTPPPPSDQPREFIESLPELPIIEDRGGVLLPRGQLVVAPSFEYDLDEINRVDVVGFTVLPAILIGAFDIAERDRETFTGVLDLRYGLLNDLEIEARVPYLYRVDTVSQRPLGDPASVTETSDASSHGLGDIEFAAHYQINTPTEGGAFYIGNMRVKTVTGQDPFEIGADELPTGTGFWGIQPSVTAIFPSDPAVFYGNVGYTLNLPRDVGGIGTIDPGDAIVISAGAGLALNERASLNFGYDHQVVFETTVDGDELQGAETLQIGRLLLGGAYQITDSIGLDVTFAFGVTEDAPDLKATVRVPISFNFF